MAKKSASIPPPSPRRNFLLRPRTILGVLLLAGLAAAYPVIKPHLPDVRRRGEYRVLTSEIQITQPPHWVPQDLVEQVAKLASLPEESSLLDEQLTREIHDAFALHPWVEEVVSVRKQVPAKIEVKLTYRRPVAMVQVRSGMYPVDRRGILLPPADFSVASTRLYPLVEGVRSTPQGPAGTSWGDPLVEGAARLSDELSSHWKKFKLTAIVVPQAGVAADTAEGVYSLRSEGGSRIVWGRAPGSDNPGELATDKKISRMLKYVTDFGGFDRPHGPYEIDIRHWQEISRKPLAARDDLPLRE
jgi:hypothetical protein